MSKVFKKFVSNPNYREWWMLFKMMVSVAVLPKVVFQKLFGLNESLSVTLGFVSFMVFEVMYTALIAQEAQSKKVFHEAHIRTPSFKTIVQTFYLVEDPIRIPNEFVKEQAELIRNGKTATT